MWRIATVFIYLAAGGSVRVLGQSQLRVGYSVLRPDGGSASLAASALFEYRNAAGVLVSEAGVGAAEPMRSGRIFVDETETATGVALVNANAQAASVALILRDFQGVEVNRTTRRLSPGEHVAQFVSQMFSPTPSGLYGSLTFESDQPLSSIALRQTTNFNQEPVYSTLSVANLDTAPTSASLVIPHIAIGGGYAIEVVLVNRSTSQTRAQMSFFHSDGTPWFFDSSGGSVSGIRIDIAGQGVAVNTLSSTENVSVGYVTVTPDAGFSTPSGLANFRVLKNNALVSEAGVFGVSTTAAKIFVDYVGTQTGLALVNSGSQAATVNFTLSDRFGNPTDTTQRTLAPRQHLPIFAHELFPEIVEGFTGILDIRSTYAVTAVTLKLTSNTRGDLLLTTLPVADLTQPPSSQPVVLPQIAIGGGFSTRIITLNPGTTASGHLNFYVDDGTSLAVLMEEQTGSSFSYQLGSGAGRRFLPGNTAKMAFMYMADSSGQPTSEVAVNEGGTVPIPVQALDTAGRIRDDFDPIFAALDTSIATASGSQVKGIAAGFSTLTVSARGMVMNATITVTKVASGAPGYRTTTGIVRDLAGRLYLSSTDDHTVLLTQNIGAAPAVYAGKQSTAGLKNDVRLESQFRNPSFLAFNQFEGSLYVSDSQNNVIRRVTSGTDGRVTTLAGTGAKDSADGSVASAAFNNPQGVAFDDRGNLWVVDTGNNTIRKIDLIRNTVTTVAGRPGVPGYADGQGSAALFNSPTGIAFEYESDVEQAERRSSNKGPRPVQMVVADTGNGFIRRVDENGNVSTIQAQTSAMTIMRGMMSLSERAVFNLSTSDKAAARFTGPSGVSTDGSGNIFVTEPASKRVRAILQNGEIVDAVQPKTFTSPHGLVNVEGTVVVTDSDRGSREVSYGEPVITSVTPTRVSNLGGTLVTVKGRNFSPDTLLFIHGDAAPDVYPDDTQTIRFTVGAVRSGRTTITLLNRGGIAQGLFEITPQSLQSLPAGYITTFAGGTTFSGDGQVGTTAYLAKPRGVAVDTAGNVFIADWVNNTIRRVSSQTGVITTVAGRGLIGFTEDGVLGNEAYLYKPFDVVADAQGNVYFISGDGVFKLSAETGLVSAVAGGGYLPASAADNGPATDAELNLPIGLALDGSGHLFISDFGDDRIRMVSLATGIITTVAGNGITSYSGDNGPATSAALDSPRGIAVDRQGNLYIADQGNFRVRKVDARSRIITTVAGSGTLDFEIDSGPATKVSIGPYGVAVDNDGNLWITDNAFERIRRVDGTGALTTVAGTGQSGFSGDGGPARQARLAHPWSIAVDAAGNVIFSDSDNHRVRKISATTGIITTIAGSADPSHGGDSGPAALANLRGPFHMAFDADGNFLFTESLDQRIRKIDRTTGIISTFAGTELIPTGDLDLGDNGPATQAKFFNPHGIVVDRSGNVFIADSWNYRVRKISRNGIVTTIAGTGVSGFSGDGGPAIKAELNSPEGLAVDSAGNVFVADTDNHRIRRIDAISGAITTVAGNGSTGFEGDGGPATRASLWYPEAVDVDDSGNLYIADTWNDRIRVVNPSTGIIRTIAGNGKADFAGDGGQATAASLDTPKGVRVDANGLLWIADFGNDRIRRVNLRTGVITTVAGADEDVLDNYPATQTGLDGPTATLSDAAGNLYIVEGWGSRIRAVRGPIP